MYACVCMNVYVCMHRYVCICDVSIPVLCLSLCCWLSANRVVVVPSKTTDLLSAPVQDGK